MNNKTLNLIFLNNFQLADWWLDLAYLTYRSPVVVWSSPGIVWPRREFSDVDDQLDYASKVIAGLIDFKLMLDK